MHTIAYVVQVNMIQIKFTTECDQRQNEVFALNCRFVILSAQNTVLGEFLR